jgi:ABC-type sugar transport system ATPase subunit
VPVIEAVTVSKAFGATTALVDVSLKAYAGRILALLSDNGAGKSTLIKVLSSVFPPDRGELRFRGKPVVFGNPAEARQRGIATVFQDLAVCELLSVTRNIVLGLEPQKGIGPLKWLDVKKADEMARSALPIGSAFAVNGGSTSAASISRVASASPSPSPAQCFLAPPYWFSTSRPRRSPCARPGEFSIISSRPAIKDRRSFSSPTIFVMRFPSPTI